MIRVDMHALVYGLRFFKRHEPSEHTLELRHGLAILGEVLLTVNLAMFLVVDCVGKGLLVPFQLLQI